MSDPFEEQAWVKIGVAGALARQYAADQKAFLEELATLLENALPAETEIKRTGGFFAKKQVQKVLVTLDSNRYTLESAGQGPLRATITHIVRGIALKTEETATEDWLAELGAALEARVQTSAAAREALSRLLG